MTVTIRAYFRVLGLVVLSFLIGSSAAFASSITVCNTQAQPCGLDVTTPPPPTNLVANPNAPAANLVPFLPVLELLPTVDPSNGLFNYVFSIGSSPLWIALPYFQDAGIQNISSPDGWKESIGPSQELLGMEAITWTAMTTNGTGGIFSFQSPYAPGNGHIVALMPDGVTFASADLLVPMTPDAVAAGAVTAPVPEPASALLEIVGLVLLAARRRISRTTPNLQAPSIA